MLQVPPNKVLPNKAARFATTLLLAFVAIMLFEASSIMKAVADEPRHLAFVVGINEYDNLGDQKQLTRAVRDADDVASKLSNLGFSIVNDVGRNIERDTFGKKWRDFVDAIDPQRGDTVAIFLSGHGVEIEGDSFFLTKNVPYIRAGRSEEIKREGISIREMILDLQTRKPKIVLMLVDACRTNPFLPREFTGKGLGGAAFTGDGVLVVYSAGGNETALDRLPTLPADSNPNSVFTRALLPMLDELKTSTLPLYRAWFQTLRNKVREIAASAGKGQSPKAYSGLEGEFCLLNSCSDQIPILPALPKKAQISNSFEISFSLDESALLDFVSRHRGSDAAKAAEYRLTELVRARSTLHVISVGIGRQGDPRLPTLRFSTTDALAISNLVSNKIGPLYKDIKVHTLTDDQATKEAIAAVFDEVSKSARASDTLIVYLSGHVWVTDDHAYLVPVNGKIDRVYDLVSLDELQERMSHSLGRVILLVDACGVPYTRSLQTTLLDRSTDAQFTVFSASVPDGMAFEQLDLGHSAFASAFLEGLSGQAASGASSLPGPVTIRNLANFIAVRVPQITDKRQIPYFVTTEENFVLAEPKIPMTVLK
ncbi:MAG TPA: caspase family protein [Bradyrhizobium sp.]|nr:caspase family protein [Bradyrhizobium sp.]